MKKCIFILTPILLFFLFAPASAKLPDNDFLKMINTDGDETSCSISGDGNYFIFSRKEKDKTTSDLYISEFREGKWSEAVPAAELNSDADEITPYISYDGKFLLFSSNRPGSLKYSQVEKISYDIYYSERGENGWSKPEQLFGVVNTADDEKNPYLSKDGKQIFFTRSPFYDSSLTKIIRVMNRDETWEDIETADISKQNNFKASLYKPSLFSQGAYILGQPKDKSRDEGVFYYDEGSSEASPVTLPDINDSSASDILSLTELDKDRIIIAIKKSGENDNYNFMIEKLNSPKKEKPGKTPTEYSLYINSEKYGKTDSIKLEALYFSSDGKDSWPVKRETVTPDENGIIKFQADKNLNRILILPYNGDIKSFSVEFLIKRKSLKKRYITIEKSENIIFKPEPVYFNFNSSSINIKDVPYLQQVINHMRKNTELKAVLTGYADRNGTAPANHDISLKRAEEIKKYIVQGGIDKKRITVKGAGFVMEEDKPYTAQRCRRVEFIVSDK